MTHDGPWEVCNSHTTLYTCNSMAAGQPLTFQCQPHITKGERTALFSVNLIDVENHVTLKWGRTFKVISPNSHLEQKRSHCPGPDREAPCHGASLEACSKAEHFLGQQQKGKKKWLVLNSLDSVCRVTWLHGTVTLQGNLILSISQRFMWSRD